jgi:predicted MFS family arabinose efflux permease
MRMAVTARDEWARHWRVVLGCGLAFGTGYSLFGYVSSLFIDELSAEFGWTRGEISTASAVGLIGALAAPFIGRAADRFGARRVALVCFAALAGVYGLFATLSGWIWALYGLMMLFAMVGAGTGGLTLTRPVNSYFSAGRGLALAVMLAGVTVTAIILPPVVERINSLAGWRWSYGLLAGLCLFVAIPAILLVVHERAEPPRPAGLPTAYPGQDWRTLWRSRDFWVLCGALAIMNAPAAGIVTQLAPILQGEGLDRAQAAQLLSVMGAAVLVGRLASGFLLDRLPPRLVAMLFTAAPALGCLLLLLVPEVTFAHAVLAVVLLGVQQGSETDLLAFFTARQFGLRRYSSIYGAAVMMGLLGTALGVAFVGNSYEITGSYDLALVLSAALFPVAGALFLILRRQPQIDDADGPAG